MNGKSTTRKANESRNTRKSSRFRPPHSTESPNREVPIGARARGEEAERRTRAFLPARPPARFFPLGKQIDGFSAITAASSVPSPLLRVRFWGRRRAKKRPANGSCKHARQPTFRAILLRLFAASPARSWSRSGGRGHRGTSGRRAAMLITRSAVRSEARKREDKGIRAERNGKIKVRAGI